MVATVSDELQRWRHNRLCETRETLFGEWRDGVEVYVMTLSDLIAKAGRVPDSELLLLAKTTEVGRILAANTRAELDEHIAEHCC